jgi:hypothetical protein
LFSAFFLLFKEGPGRKAEKKQKKNRKTSSTFLGARPENFLQVFWVSPC